MTPPTRIPKRYQNKTATKQQTTVPKKTMTPKRPETFIIVSDTDSTGSSGSKRGVPDLEDAPNSVDFSRYENF